MASDQEISKEVRVYSGIERAAIMMFSLPEKQTKEIIASLDESEVKDLSKAMTSLGAIEATIVERLCMEFVSEIASSSLVGSIETTRRLLLKFMSKEEVDAVLANVHGPAGRSLWDKLDNVDEELLSGYLKNESPQTIALIMSRISAETSSKILTLLPQVVADEVVLRIIRMDTVRNEVIEDIEQTLSRDFLSTLGRSVKKDPYEMMAEMFNTLDRAAETRLIDLLRKLQFD